MPRPGASSANSAGTTTELDPEADRQGSSVQAMDRATLGDGLSVSAIGSDAMGRAPSTAPRTSGGACDDRPRARARHAARHREMYGPYTNEQLVGSALAGQRDTATVLRSSASLGADGRQPDAPGHRRVAENDAALHRGLARASRHGSSTSTTAPHRPEHADRNRRRARRLVAGGKVRHIGLSEGRAEETIRRAHAVRHSPPCEQSTRCGPGTSGGGPADAA